MIGNWNNVMHKWFELIVSNELYEMFVGKENDLDQSRTLQIWGYQISLIYRVIISALEELEYLNCVKLTTHGIHCHHQVDIHNICEKSSSFFLIVRDDINIKSLNYLVKDGNCLKLIKHQVYPMKRETVNTPIIL